MTHIFFRFQMNGSSLMPPICLMLRGLLLINSVFHAPKVGTLGDNRLNCLRCMLNKMEAYSQPSQIYCINPTVQIGVASDDCQRMQVL
jgi:hypothetical protein